MDIDGIRQNLIDAGCEDRDIEKILQQFASCNVKEALRSMKKVRCKKIDEMHICARKVDCLDYLIRDTENKMKTD